MEDTCGFECIPKWPIKLTGDSPSTIGEYLLALCTVPWCSGEKIIFFEQDWKAFLSSRELTDKSRYSDDHVVNEEYENARSDCKVKNSYMGGIFNF